MYNIAVNVFQPLACRSICLLLYVAYVANKLLHCVETFSGGTEVTIEGSNLNSVAQPRINLTVIVTRFHRDIRTPLSKTYSSTEVLYIIQLSCSGSLHVYDC